MKAAITTIILIVLFVLVYFGITNHAIREAEADEKITYLVHVMDRTKYGYIPSHDFRMTKASLEAHIKVSWWEAHWQNSGDLLIGIEVGDSTWFVKLSCDDPEINNIRKIVKNYGLQRSVPER